IQANQSDVIATLTSGVAHDLNNLLGSLQTLQFLLERSREGSVPTPATALEEVVERGTWLADQLEQLGRHADDDVQSVNLREFLKDSLHLFRRLLGDARTITLVDHYPEAHVLVKPQKLRRTLLHVLRNAREATLPTGALTLSIERAPKGMVELRVTDD